MILQYFMFSIMLFVIIATVAIGDSPECKRGYSCKDCHTSLVCASDKTGKLTVVSKVKCPPTSPFCSSASGSCTGQPQPNCGSEESNVTSTTDGIFVDSNCTIFHNCSKGKCTRFECGTLLVYNPMDHLCEKGACGTYPCRKVNVAVAHTVYPKYYSDCKPSPTIRFCPGEFEFDNLTKKCEAVCRKEGVIQDIYDCQKYYVCTHELINSTIVMTKSYKTCPNPYVYDPKDRVCGTIMPRNIENCTVNPNEGWEIPPTAWPPVPTYPPKKTRKIQKKNPVECVSNGRFPTDKCEEVLVCNDTLVASYHVCDSGLTYNSHFEQCLPEQKCGTFSCLQAGEKVPHSVDPTYYAYCENSSSAKVIDNCPTPFQLNVTSQRCELNCSYEGAYRDPFDCNKYFVCQKSWINGKIHYFQKFHETCPTGYGFDYHNFACVKLPSQWIPECGGLSPPTARPTSPSTAAPTSLSTVSPTSLSTAPPTTPSTTTRSDDITTHCLSYLPDKCKRLDLPYQIDCTRSYIKLQSDSECQSTIQTLIDTLPNQNDDIEMRAAYCLNLLPTDCRLAYLPYKIACTRYYINVQRVDQCVPVIQNLIQRMPKTVDRRSLQCLQGLPDSCKSITSPFQIECANSYIEVESTGKCRNLIKELIEAMPVANATLNRIVKFYDSL